MDTPKQVETEQSEQGFLVSDQYQHNNQFSVWGFIKGFGKLVIGFLLVLQGLIGLILLLFLVSIFTNVMGVFGGNNDRAQFTIEEGSAFVLNPRGVLVEVAPPEDPLAQAFAEAYGVQEAKAISIHDVVRTIRSAKKDKRITAMILDLDSLAISGTSKAYTLVDAVKSFKESGKKVYAISNFYGQTQYLIASHADEVYINDGGAVALYGYGIYNNYYKSLFEKLKVTSHIFRVGTFKSAVEPRLRDDMSPEAASANLELVNAFWDRYTETVGQARAVTAESIHDFANGYNLVMREFKGDAAKAAISRGLVDKAIKPSQTRKFLTETFGENRSGNSFKGVGFNAYLQSLPQLPTTTVDGKPYVAVITAAGVIVPGNAESAGNVAASGPIIRYLRAAKEDDNVKAVVLRVDSPGGSAFASELMHDAILDLRAAGKPVVVSMGSLAASGGYLIAVAGDEIWAQPTTVTGSIGIFAAFETFENLAAEAGVYTDGVGTTAQSAILGTGIGELPAVTAESLQLGTENGYDRFLTFVAEGRDLEKSYVDQVGQGRVWIGEKALELKLVDKIGSFDEAIQSAAAKAGLDDYSVIRYQDRRTPIEKILGTGTTAALKMTGAHKSLARSGVFPTNTKLGQLVTEFENRLPDLANYTDPNHLYMRCVQCDVVSDRR